MKLRFHIKPHWPHLFHAVPVVDVYQSVGCMFSYIISALVHWMRVPDFILIDSNSRPASGDTKSCQAQCEQDRTCHGLVFQADDQTSCLQVSLEPNDTTAMFYAKETGIYHYKCVFGESGKPGKWSNAVFVHVKEDSKYCILTYLPWVCNCRFLGAILNQTAVISFLSFVCVLALWCMSRAQSLGTFQCGGHVPSILFTRLLVYSGLFY